MAIYYVDLASGSDAAAGTNVAPLLTVNAAVAKASGPHDIRVAKTSAYTSISGATFTWTNNSTSVSTSADKTASIAAGDYIGTTTAAGNGAEETFYRVVSITSATITLELKYGGTTKTESSVNKLVVVTTGAAGATAMTCNTTGTTISGGWNLSTQAQDGETWFKSNGLRTATSAYGLTLTANATVSKMNCAESYVGFTINGGTASTFTNCTSSAYVLGYYFSAGSAGTFQNCCGSNFNANSAIYIAGTPAITITSCYLYSGLSGLGCLYYNSTPSGTVSNCKFNSGIYGINCNSVTASPITYSNNIISNCTTGYYQPGANAVIDGFTFNNCGTGVKANVTNNLASGYVIRNCTFQNGTGTAITTSYCKSLLVDSCTFSSVSYGISMDQYSGDHVLTNCTFTTPTNYAIYRENGACGTAFIYGCSIDSASQAKAYNITAVGYNMVQYILQGSFGQSGTIYGAGAVLQEATVYRTTPPSLSISWAALTTNNAFDIKIGSAYVNANNARTFAFYLKASNASWSGTLIPKWKINGKLIKTESSITSVTTSWVQYSYTCAGNLITSDGELSLEFQTNMNAYAVYVDDLVVS